MAAVAAVAVAAAEVAVDRKRSGCDSSCGSTCSCSDRRRSTLRPHRRSRHRRLRSNERRRRNFETISQNLFRIHNQGFLWLNSFVMRPSRKYYLNLSQNCGKGGSRNASILQENIAYFACHTHSDFQRYQFLPMSRGI